MLFETRSGEAATKVVAGAATKADEPSKIAMLSFGVMWICTFTWIEVI